MLFDLSVTFTSCSAVEMREFGTRRKFGGNLATEKSAVLPRGLGGEFVP